MFSKLECSANEELRYSVTATCFQSQKKNLMKALKIYWPINKINHLCTFGYLALYFSVGAASLLLDCSSFSINTDRAVEILLLQVDIV